MKPILLVRNDAFETFGVAPKAFAGAGTEVAVWEAVHAQPVPSLDDVGGVVVFGSSYNVEHADEQPFIQQVAALTREAVDREVPYLGVCFGAQLLAWSMGAEVEKSPVREVGFEPIHPLEPAAADPLLSHYRDGDRVFQWHMDTFALPAGAERLITGDAIENQAYRLGPTTWGVQFHFEIDEAEIALWLDAFDDDGGDVAAEWGKPRATIKAEARTHIAEHERKGTEVFARFASIVGRRTAERT